MLLSRIEFINGILIFILLGIFFLVLDSLGFSDNIYLRFFNIFFVFFGINRTVNQKVMKGETSYFGNFKSALMTSLIAALFSIAGLAIYITYFKGEGIVSDLAQSIILGDKEVDLLKYCAALLVEGLVSSLLLTFVFMQYWRITHGLKKSK